MLVKLPNAGQELFVVRYHSWPLGLLTGCLLGLLYTLCYKFHVCCQPVLYSPETNAEQKVRLMTTDTPVEIVMAEQNEDIEACFPVMVGLRPHLKARSFVARVRQQQASGYHLVYLQAHSAIRSVAGFRLLDTLAWGKILYIDDLVTLPDAQGQGYAGHLIDWLVDYARARQCDQIHLDSGYQRHAAHRFYLGRGFVLASHHFALKLDETM